jgi:Zn-dependent protease with chaperone function
MNFFEQQDHARRQTRKLVILFALAVVAIVATVNVALALIWNWSHAAYLTGVYGYPRGFFVTNTLVTVALIAVGTLIELYNLREGGDAVAKMAGGRLVSPASRDLQERRLLNVVEEMALASGIACPKVYLLDREDAINAFAAGYNQNEAVIALTQGALARLTRDELQGVVAHEFSHILNGDMRLNIRLIGLLFGIQMLAGFGQQLMYLGSQTWTVRDRDDKGPSAQFVLLVAGAALFAIGYIGIVFGRLIKSAVSRQREFLADASAVQFTRNADGIGGALRKIGGLSRSMQLGSRIRHPNAEQLSHLFLGAPKPSLIDGMFATHPPIEERLRRIYGRSVSVLDAPELAGGYATESETLPDIPYVAADIAGAALQAQWIAFGNSAGATQSTALLAPELDSAVRDPQAACAVVYALLLGGGAERDTQLAVLKSDAPAQAALVPVLAHAIERMPKSARLPLLDMAMPALKQLPQAACATLLAVVDRLIAADNKMSLAEFVLQTVLVRRLDARAGRATPVRFTQLEQLRPDCITLLSLVAHASAPGANRTASDLFANGAAHCPELALSRADLAEIAVIDFQHVKAALDRVHQLAPLAKPAFIKAVLAAGGDTEPMAVATADLLRAICAAIDAPVPSAVAATYAAYHWQF